MNGLSYKKLLATVIVLTVLGFVLYALWPFFNALFGAAIMAMVFLPIYNWLVKKGMRRGIASILVITISILIIVLPFTYVATIALQEANKVLLDTTAIQGYIEVLNQKINGETVRQYLPDIASNLGQFTKWLIASAIGSITRALLTLAILYFTMYYMLIHSDKLKKVISKYTPFKPKHTKKLVDDFHTITYATVISTVIIGALQGLIFGITLKILGVQAAMLWGFIAVLVASVPVLGIPFVWVPAAVIMFLLGDWTGAIAITIVGLILSNGDVFVRAYIQDRVGHVHPLVTLLGFLIGVPYFGIAGIVIGPLLLQYALHMAKIYKEEF